MKLENNIIVQLAKILATDEQGRLEEYNKYKTLESSVLEGIFKQVKVEFPNGEYFDKNTIEGWHGKLLGKYVIIFRGADSIPDWIRSFIFSKKTIPYVDSGTNKNIKVHRGFLRNYLIIREVIHNIVKENIEEKEFVIFGHSMGGAIAALCALDIQYNFKKDVAGATLGMPRVGNKYFIESFNKRVPEFIRFTYGSDVVPCLPTEWMGYKHLGNEKHLGHKPTFWKSKSDHNWNVYYNAIKDELK